MREAVKEFDYFLLINRKEQLKKRKARFSFALFCNFITSSLFDEADFDLMRNYSFVETFLKQSFYAFASALSVVES